MLKSQLDEMFALQESLNAVVNENWRDSGFEWYRAIWIECAEMMDHYGWKWWKNQVHDKEQVKLEIVDIWHFVISWWLQIGLDADACMKCVDNQTSAVQNIPQTIEKIASFSLIGYVDMTTVSLFQLINNLDMSHDELYQWYIGKNVLNQFRQDNGYKAGTYRKEWSGLEDNVHLANIINDVYTQNPKNFKESLYNQLSVLYAENM